MRRLIVYSAAAFLFIGTAFATDKKMAGSHGDGHGKHDHTDLVEMPAGMPVPTVSVKLSPDPMSGWNLHVTTENFRFAPEQASRAHRPGEGHAHIYVDGMKIARLYGPWFHIGKMPSGARQVLITLNTNDHRHYAAAGKPIQASVPVKAASAGPGPCPGGKVCFDLAIHGGKLHGASDTLRVKQDDELELRWTTDAATDLHLHGYDLRAKVQPGTPSTMAFKAHATGRFSVEVHGAGGTHATLMYLEVHPR